ncbi:tRNA preQ1(34) S-adenosylmethionine ribosyltransferase-isomerase QueA [Intestinimonas timonensis]|uniref:tRNA preQ1(34) S-adenosylmethionine ribosyltransferase-isomerase QueA n=1 Tax=Intestinimonas timonensis TaxID=1689270 RepID=UPI0024B08FDF|nr:tRNA preQ1(34) S-adenosylmethionine ribosyltransferase-isomerase QueA [Intestinimonas timonensis]
MKTSDFYYDLPQELIAQTPLDRRDGSRLMVLDKNTGAVKHMHFYDLPSLLRPGDCLVLNDSRVLPARLLGHREPGGGAAEVLLLNDKGDKTWECLVRPGKKMKPGTKLSFGDGLLTAEVTETLEGGNRLVRFHYDGIFLELLEQLGKMPLPPYIKAELQDPERYQTVYSREVGSAAAPTAGLHFTKELLEQIQAMGVSLAYVTLHVGLGTFRPVKEEEITDHEMHSEYCMISKETAETINETRRKGGRVICVGTTSCRTIESWAAEDGTLKESAGWTNIYIYPGYRFKVLDALITNFHLPESTLVMLVSALAGREHILAAYEEAVREKYRFFSFGDAMFIGDQIQKLPED